MKIVCEACAAKYSISDDKVRGKVFKIRCKKCSHIIVVRGTEDAGGAAAEEPNAAQSLTAAAVATEAVWYVVIEGEQVGPLTELDVAARVSRGDVGGETFAWREGMADWIQVSAIAEFAGSLASAPADGGGDAESPFAPQPTAVYPPGTPENIFGEEPETPAVAPVRSGPGRSEATEVFGAPTAIGKPPVGHDLFAPQVDHGGFAAAAPTVTSSGGQHSAPAPLSLSSLGGGGGFFPTSAPAPSGGAGLTGQRSENSVLFSLSNLESLAGGHGSGASQPPASRGFSSAPAPVTEGSGLIDIRSMAKMTMGKQAEQPSMFGGMQMSAPELPTFSASPIAPLAPMLLPSRQSGGIPAWAWVVGTLVVVALGGLSWVILKGPDVVPVAPPTVAPAPAPAPGSAEPPTTAQPVPAPAAVAPAKDEALPPRDENNAPRDKPVAKKTGGGATPKKTNTSGKSEGEPAAKAEPTRAEPAVKEAPPPAAKKGSLDDLLAGAMGTPKKATPTPSAAPAPSAEPSKKSGPLGKGDIVKGMMGIMPKTKACYDQYKVPGTASVNVKVDTSGRVDSANVTGKFAGTPTGECVERAVKSAKFPPSDGLSFPYPIPLR